MGTEKPFFNSKLPLNFAHRGFSGKFPENTLPAFQKAMEAGADVLELDIRLTKDKHVVVIHDSTVNRTTDGSGWVSDLTISELKKITVLEQDSCRQNESGLKIMLLNELFSLLPGCRFNIDIKQHDRMTCQTLLDIIKDFNMQEKVLVVSSNYQTIEHFRSISGKSTATGASFKEILNFMLRGKLFRRKIMPDALQIPEYYFGLRILSEKFILRAHQKGIAVHAWTINKKEDMMRLLDWKIDGIMTDFPDLLSNTISTKNLTK